MNLPNYNIISSDNSNTPTHLYLLQMDSSNTQKANNTLNLPLHILNNSEECSNGQLLLPIQTKAGGQDQLKAFLDVNQESIIKFVTLHMETDCEQHQKEYLSSIKCANSKESPEALSETQLVDPSLVNSSGFNRLQQKQAIQNYIHISDRSVLPRAIAVLPSILQIRQSDVIAPRRTLPVRTRFGPVIGIKHKISDTEMNELVLTATTHKTPLFVFRDENDVITHIDVSDKDKSNWIGLLPLGDEDSANVWIYEENTELYIVTTEEIPSRKQLMLGYSKKYAQDYGLYGTFKDIETERSLNVKTWWCYECHRALPSSTHLQRHMNTYHQEYKPIKTRRYRCRNCMLTFSRIFTLRRHMARHCKKKSNKSDNLTNSEIPPETSLTSTLNTEDIRVPSDESFQNYSNSLDFPTNLFDTDRISSLDISGNSRSEIFNPYVLDNENTLANDLIYGNGNLDIIDTPTPTSNDNVENYDQQNSEPSQVSCPYCNENVVKGKMRLHVSACSARRFECECKKVFTSQEQLAHHIYTQHSNEEKPTDLEETASTNAIEDPKPYKCEQCQHAFKRRGMLINHLWQKHDLVSARVPLERRVRHYPCVACPKLYRTATKRDRHVLQHHPEAPRAGARVVEGGRRPCAPAACPACPRQYSARAKMLQHVRRHHPHLVASMPKKVKSTVNPENKI